MNKKTYPYHLTAAEESVLDILWNSKDPLTGQQIIEEAKKDESKLLAGALDFSISQ